MTKHVKPVLNVPTVTPLEEAGMTLTRLAARKWELALNGSNPRGDLAPIPERNNVDLRRSGKAAFPDSLLSLNFPAPLVDDGTGPFLLEAS